VFFPHNIWAVYADRLALETATILERAGEIEELSRLYERGREAPAEPYPPGRQQGV
jgi:hypothetical protein